ncbi:hypothetical protein GCM10025873_23890 [Demequina sediminis]|uniref:hypothetical protein n=1 Tax=Demequina sediminis TaxID=1930058 RepID=UPI002572C85C|nr:hypothetical protein [Demequina sediminis]BDZ62598.1 hypothetical protein GCM10025873_23890 [Demequina sediminis]
MSVTSSTAKTAPAAMVKATGGDPRPAIAPGFFKAKGATRENPLVNAFLTAILAVGAVIMAAPLLWMVSTSLKTKEGVYALPRSGFPIRSCGTRTCASSTTPTCCRASGTR